MSPMSHSRHFLLFCVQYQHSPSGAAHVISTHQRREEPSILVSNQQGTFRRQTPHPT